MGSFDWSGVPREQGEYALYSLPVINHFVEQRLQEMVEVHCLGFSGHFEVLINTEINNLLAH